MAVRSMVALAALLGALLLLLAASPASAASCMEVLAGEGADVEWIDPDTPAEVCTIALCTGPNAICTGPNPPLTAMTLAFSDEFEAPGRSLAVEAGDPRWTADRMWYAGTSDLEVYEPDQVTTAGGAAQITMEAAPGWGPSQRDTGAVWNVTKDHRSGFFHSWNKFCFTGGYIEAGLHLPGDDYISGFWPAFWLMGNLGRPGYMASTGGMWPYTYDTCGGGTTGADKPGANRPQSITACPDPPGFDRTKYGLKPGQGRGAPEIDMVEVKVPPSINEDTGEPTPLGLPRGGGKGQHPKAFNSMTLQLGPLLPNGTTWMDPANSASPQGPLGPGMYLPQDGMKPGGPLEGMWTHATYWKGEFADGMLPQLQALGNEDLLDNIRPGNLVQDSVSVMATLGPQHFQGFHKYGLDWQPGEHIRWYLDDVMVYEISKEALRAQAGPGGETTFERLVPLEPMFIILNFAMSPTFTAVDIDRLQFPAQYKIDYVRVWQSESNVGCSPPDFPTAQYLACKRDTYVNTEADQALIPGVCDKLPSCRSEWGYERQGGELYSGKDIRYEVTNVTTPQECCQICAQEKQCGAYNWNPYFGDGTCALLKPTGWTKKKVGKDYEGIITGVVYDAGSDEPRGASSPPSPKPPPSPGAPPAPVSAAVGGRLRRRIVVIGGAAGLANGCVQAQTLWAVACTAIAALLLM